MPMRAFPPTWVDSARTEEELSKQEMMKPGKITLAAVVALVLFADGCEGPFKKKKAAPPPSIPPTIEKNPKLEIPQPQPTPPPQPKPQPTIEQTPPQPKPQPKRKPTKKVVVPPPAPETTTPQPTQPAPDASINAPMTNQQAERQRQQTSNLLGAAESNLTNIRRALNVDEQNMVAQIRNYIAQSRKAMTDGDLERAYNLANKANLLSSELVKE